MSKPQIQQTSFLDPPENLTIRPSSTNEIGITQEDPYIKMETALAVRDSDGVYDVPVTSRQPSPVGDPTSLVQNNSNIIEHPDFSVQGDKTGLFAEDDYVNPALFREEAANNATNAADTSIYESMTVGDQHPYAKVKSPAAKGAGASGGNAEGLYDKPLDALLASGNRVLAKSGLPNSELQRTFTADNQYVLVRPQTGPGRRNASSQPTLDIDDDPYSNLSELDLTRRTTISGEAQASPYSKLSDLTLEVTKRTVNVGDETHVTPSNFTFTRIGDSRQTIYT